MPPEIILIAVVADALILALGGIVTHQSYRAYRRTAWPVLRVLSIGFGLVTLGALLGGWVHQLLGADFVVGVAIQSGISAVGFGFITYAVYAGRPGSTAVDPAAEATWKRI